MADLAPESCESHTTVEKLGDIPITKGEFQRLPKKVQKFIAEWADECKPKGIYICDGSQQEADEIVHQLEMRGTLHRLSKYENCYACRTDPGDVSRVESTTWVSTGDKYKTVPHVKAGVDGILGQWKSESEGRQLLNAYKGCMKGRTMYIIPFRMGPIRSTLSKVGVEITDSEYVVVSMRIMTRVSPGIWDVVGDGDFVRCVHSVGQPRPVQSAIGKVWPCNPEKQFLCHFPEKREVCSFGSGFGQNSLPGKESFGLRLASNIAIEEGWLAEHMLIMGITEKRTGRETFIAAAFPNRSGKTTMAMLTPSNPEYDARVTMPITTWLNRPWVKGSGYLAAHPNSRFCVPASQCPIIHPKWEDKEGVPISAIIFGGRRPQGVPLVYETLSWEHGVMVGACVKSETPSAAGLKGKQIKHDPMAMRSFIGYNFGHYLGHWLQQNQPSRKMPKIFHVNWFRVDEDGQLLWPGFGENIRVLDWIIKRIHDDHAAADVVKSPIGFLPKEGSLNCDGLDVNWDKMFDLQKQYLEEDIVESKTFLSKQVGTDLPDKITEELEEQEKRIQDMLS